MTTESLTVTNTTIELVMNTTYGTFVNTSLQTEQPDNAWTPPDFEVTAKNILMAIVLTVLDVVTLVGNLVVLVAFFVDSRLRQPFNLFIMNLAVTDFLVAITAMPFYTIDTLLGYWPFGQVMCGVWIYFDFAMTFASVFTLVAISVDRFWCVTWAINYKLHNNKTKTIISLAVVWVLVVVIWTPPFIADRMANDVENYCIWAPSDNRQFVVFVAVVGHYIPCVLMVFCYIKVFVIMRKQAKLIADNTGLSRPPSTMNPSMTAANQMTGKTKMTSSSSQESDSNVHVTSLNPKLNGGHMQEKGTRQYLHVNNRFSAQSNDSDRDVESRRSPIPPSGSSLNRDKKIFITLTYVVGSYLICWFPFYVCFDTYAWRPELVPSGLYSFFFWMTYVNSTLNPFLYAYTSKDFRIAFLRVIRCLYSCKVK